METPIFFADFYGHFEVTLRYSWGFIFRRIETLGPAIDPDLPFGGERQCPKSQTSKTSLLIFG
jgi:hypothetical protein